MGANKVQLGASHFYLRVGSGERAGGGDIVGRTGVCVNKRRSVFVRKSSLRF